MTGTEPQPRASSDEPAAVPWFVRILDLASVGLVCVGLSVLAFGGFRLRLDTLRLSMQSPVRVVVVTVAVLAVRHLLLRRPHLGERLAGAWRRWRVDAAVHEAVLATLAVRLPVLLAGYFAVLILGYASGPQPPFRASPNEVINLPARWDAGWYLGIAIDGYHHDPGQRGQQNIAFFPAYPLMMRLGGVLLGARRPADLSLPSVNLVEVERRISERTVLAGWLLSIGATAFALVYLFRFARETLGGEAPSGSVWLISAYPFAYFFGALYTEGLFLLGAVATFHHFRRAEWGRAAAWGALVGLTRPNGCLLSVPLGLMAVQRVWWPGTLRAGDPPPANGWRALLTGLVTAAAPGLGMLAFSAWLWRLTGHPLAWMEAHAAWGRTFQGVDDLLVDRWRTIGDIGLYEYSRHAPIEALYVAALLGCLLALWPVMRRLGWAYGVLMLVTVLPPLAAGGFLSMGRITSTLFPVFVHLGWRIGGHGRLPVVAAFVALQGMLAALFFTWRPVF